MPIHRSSSFPRLNQPAQSLKRSKSIDHLNSSGHSTSSAISIGQGALQFARRHLRKGCCNLRAGYSGSTRPWIPRTPTVSLKLIQDLRAQCNGNVHDYVDSVMKAQFGNCGEASYLVCDYLTRAGLLALQDFNRVSLWPDDHSFVVLYQNADEKGLFPFNFSHWNESAVIIDAWMGICVAARHFPEVWCMMLDTMDAVDYELFNYFYDSECNTLLPKWIRASAAHWKQIPCSNKKIEADNTPRRNAARYWNKREGKPDENRIAFLQSPQ